MLEHDDPKKVYAALRQQSAEDPKHARQEFCELLDDGSEKLTSILELASAPGEGRVRQLIANAVRARDDKTKISPYLFRWLKTETDEFAKRAIEAALDGIGNRAYKPSKRKTLVDPSLADTYRYVTSRIRHQLNNALMGPGELLIRFTDKIESIEDQSVRSEMESMVYELKDTLRRLGRVVAFVPDDDYFVVRDIAIKDWLSYMNEEYGQKYRPINLSVVDSSPGDVLHVRANDYLMQTIFWNLWTNAQQAVDGTCEIEVHMRKTGDKVELTIIDNGDGFPKTMGGVAFLEKYSSKGSGRGRGLLEVQDAVDRLHGTVYLAEINCQYRVRIYLPVEGS